MELDALRAFLAREFPQNTCTVDMAEGDTATVRQVVDERHLRPGGTISGPTMMTVADCAAYVAILSHYGEVALAVTTSLNINFLRKPQEGRDIIGECKIIKAGKRLVVCEIAIHSDGLDDMVAHVTATYSVPPATKQ